MKKIQKQISDLLTQIENDGLFKNERIISSQQDANIIANNKSVLNFCSNNYLGLSNNKELIKYAQEALYIYDRILDDYMSHDDISLIIATGL